MCFVSVAKNPDPEPQNLRRRASGHELALHYGDGLSDDVDALPGDADTERSASARDLPRPQDLLAQDRGPVRREAAVRQPGDRILVDAGRRRKEARHEIELRLARAAGDDDADTARGGRGELAEVRGEA